MNRKDVVFQSGGAAISAWLYLPDGERNRLVPAVAMAHGFSAVKEMGLDRFAERFAEAGMAVCVFDHPRFGASGGEPRQDVDPDAQLLAYRDAITFLQESEAVDGERIGVWGTSYSGGHAATLAATDQRVRCAVSQVPYMASPAPDVPPPLVGPLEMDKAAQAKGEPPMTLPVVAEDQSAFCALRSPDSYPWFTSWGDRAPTWRNEVTLASIATFFRYSPASHLGGSGHAPLLAVLAEGDVLAPASVARDALATTAGSVEIVTLDAGHFDAYDTCFEEAAGAACSFFERHLRP